MFADHQQAYHSEFRQPGVVVHTAVATHEPPGQPLNHRKVVPVELTMLHEADVPVHAAHGPVAPRARQERGMRPWEIRQGALAVHTGEGLLIVLRLQRAGRRALSAAEFLRGQRDLFGRRLGV